VRGTWRFVDLPPTFSPNRFHQVVGRARRSWRSVLTTSIEAFCAHVRVGLDHATFPQRRALVEILIDRVIVTGHDVEIRYVMPTNPDGPHQPFCHLRKDYRGSPLAARPDLRRGSLPPVRRPGPPDMAACRNLVLTLIRRTGSPEIAAFRQHVRSHPTNALRFLVPRTCSWTCSRTGSVFGKQYIPANAHGVVRIVEPLCLH